MLFDAFIIHDTRIADTFARGLLKEELSHVLDELEMEGIATKNGAELEQVLLRYQNRIMKASYAHLVEQTEPEAPFPPKLPEV